MVLDTTFECLITVDFSEKYAAHFMGTLNRDTNREKLSNPIVPHMVPDTTYGHLLMHITQSNMRPTLMDTLNWDQNQEKLPN